MDIAALSIMKNQVQLKQNVGLAVMKKAMSNAENNSTIVNQMLDKVAEGKVQTKANLPHMGSNVDVQV
ncbi:MAG: putative motility protein [Firmicutes bacterium]|nr:putative motility protein [Bacillota bacterium]